LALTVKRKKGVIVEFNGKSIAFDPSTRILDCPAFITHAHADHAASFKNPEILKYATEPTFTLINTTKWGKPDNWIPVNEGETFRLDDIEIRAHNAGHVLGSVQYEVDTPEGTILYTGDFSLGNSYTMKSALAINCDILVLETTFGAPMFKFPKRKDVALEMVRWAVMETLSSGRIPTFKTDSMGNAQEIIYIFNNFTNLPVITSKSVTRVSDIYKQYGYSLDYIDADSPEGKEILESGRCTMIVPKGTKLRSEKFDSALVSGWATIMNRRSKAFPLSDHADFRELISFIRRCHPKRVLTFHGGAMTRGFPEYIRKKLKIDARPLTSKEETIKGTVSKREMRVKACVEQLAKTIKIPGFEYTTSWLVKEMAKRGFTRNEVEYAIKMLIEKSVLQTTATGIKLYFSS
jgi:Cft2 family RNA processing exonuclease